MTATALSAEQLLRIANFDQDDADALENAIEVSSSLTVVDLRLSPYSVIPNDSTKATQNRVGIQLAISTLANCTLQLPAGDIYVNQLTTGSSPHNSLTFDNRADLVLRGEGMGITTLIKQGAGGGNDWYLIEIRNGSRRIAIRDLKLMEGTIDNPDSGYQMHLIQLRNATAGDVGEGTGDIWIERVFFGPCLGAGVKIAGEADNPVDTVRILNCTWRQFPGGIDGLGSRSCLELQRGYHDVEVANCYMEGSKNSQIDCEPTTDAVMAYFNIHDCTINNGLSQTAAGISLDGRDSQPNTRSRFHDNLVLESQVQFVAMDSLDFHNNTLYCSGEGDSPMAGNTQPLLYLHKLNSDVSIRDCHFERGAGTDAGALIYANPFDDEFYPARLQIHGCRFIQHTASDAVVVESCDDLQVADCMFHFTSASSMALNYVISNRALAKSASRTQVSNCTIHSETGKILAALRISATNGESALNVSMVNVQAPSATTYGIIFDKPLNDASVLDPYPILQGCDFTACTAAWVASNFAAGLVYPIIAGSRGSTCNMLGTVDPENNVTAMQGSMYIRQNGNSTSFWYKTSGTGTTGWTQLTIN